MEITIPIPGSARARLIEAAISQFECRGYEGASVVDIAEAAGVTTGSLYHHFRSKSGLYEVIRREMHRRMTERLEGVSAAAPGGPEALLAGFRVTIEAAARFGVSRLLAEGSSSDEDDPMAPPLARLAGGWQLVGVLASGLWREALLSVARGESTDDVLAAVGHLLRGKRPEE